MNSQDESVSKESATELLVGTQIHKILKEENFDIGETTVCNYIRELKQIREIFI